MTAKISDHIAPRVEAALNELRDLIANRFPETTFVVQEGFDPPGIYLVATVDIEDTDELVDVIGDRLVEMQVEEGLPVYGVPLHPMERVIAQLREQQANKHLAPLPLD